jgi:hypothetical protein
MNIPELKTPPEDPTNAQYVKFLNDLSYCIDFLQQEEVTSALDTLKHLLLSAYGYSNAQKTGPIYELKKSINPLKDLEKRLKANLNHFFVNSSKPELGLVTQYISQYQLARKEILNLNYKEILRLCIRTDLPLIEHPTELAYGILKNRLNDKKIKTLYMYSFHTDTDMFGISHYQVTTNQLYGIEIDLHKIACPEEYI